RGDAAPSRRRARVRADREAGGPAAVRAGGGGEIPGRAAQSGSDRRRRARLSETMTAPGRRSYAVHLSCLLVLVGVMLTGTVLEATVLSERSEEHTSELQSRGHLVCRLLLEK